MAAKALARKITRKQARSYSKLTPNGIGVTAIAALSNGRSKGKAMKAKKRLKGAAFKRSAQYKKMMAGLRRHKAGSKRKSARRNPDPMEMGYSSQVDPHVQISYIQRRAKSGKAAERKAAKEAKLATAKAKRARAAAKKKRVAAAKVTLRKRLGKSYGPFRSVKAKVGGKSVPTYAYRGSKGRPKKIPLWAILGAKSEADLRKRVSEQKTPHDRNLAKRVVAAKRRRDRVAGKVQAHGDLFTPNTKAVPFKTWSENMKANKKSGRKKARTVAQKAATKKMLAANRRAHGGKKKSGTRKRRKSGSAPKKRRTVAQRAATKKLVAYNKRHGGSKKRRKSGSKSKKRATKRTTGKRIRVKTKRGTSRKRRSAIVKALNTRARKRRTGKRYFENEGTAATPNRRRHHRRHTKRYSENRRRRHYRRNPAMEQIKSVAMIGISVTVGFLAHRGLTYLVSEKGLATVPSFQQGNMAKYRGVIGGLLVALVGIPVAAKVLPKHAAAIGAGMVTSLLHKLLVTVLTDQAPAAAAALAGYADAEGLAYRRVGMGEYLATNGYGEYLATNGFGAYQQAAAGMGAYQQAAAGFGAPMLQAAAGMGAGYQQAAAGMGEYLATGLRGIGEYETTGIQGFGDPGGWGGKGNCYTDEGIDPDVQSAEDALTQAEQMSGIGDLPTSSTWIPGQHPDPVEDAPRGARAGILEGSGGIFG